MMKTDTKTNGEGTATSGTPLTSSEQNRQTQIALAESMAQKAPDLSVACRPAIIPEQLDETKSQTDKTK